MRSVESSKRLTQPYIEPRQGDTLFSSKEAGGCGKRHDRSFYNEGVFGSGFV